MSQFDEFCIKLGEKYKDDYLKVCDDNEYNNDKALDDKHNSPQKYIQAASEQIYYYWLKKRFPSLNHDVKVVPPKDVDIYNDNDESYNLRIEVKTPEIDELNEDYDNNIIKIKMDHRYDNLPKDESISLRNFQKAMDEIIEQINAHTPETGKIAEVAKNEDLKLKTFLDNANKKMAQSNEKTINVLLICLDTQTIGEYLDHIISPYCGWFSNNSYLNLNDYLNIDYVILSNCCEAHFDSNFSFNVWDASNYFNFVIPLRCKKTPIEKSNFIAELFNDELMKFIEGKDSVYNPSQGSGIMKLQFGEFIFKEHPCFCPNKSIRKY